MAHVRTQEETEMPDPSPQDLYPRHFPKNRAAAFRDALRRVKGHYADLRAKAQFIAMAEDEEFRALLEPRELSVVDRLLPDVKTFLKQHAFGIG